MPTKSLERLILEFNKLPGVGQKSATRYAFHILNQSEEDVKNFAEALLAVKENVKKCCICGNYCESDTCNICSDNTRDHKIICVVEESKDIMISSIVRTYTTSITFTVIATYMTFFYILFNCQKCLSKIFNIFLRLI